MRLVLVALISLAYLSKAHDIHIDEDDDEDFGDQPIVILGQDRLQMPPPGSGGPPSIGGLMLEVHGHVEELVGQRNDGSLFYQKKVIEEGPGYVHVSLMQSEVPPSMT